jgi:hypothetical protein
MEGATGDEPSLRGYRGCGRVMVNEPRACVLSAEAERTPDACDRLTFCEPARAVGSG